jgi:hypothetical protein
MRSAWDFCRFSNGGDRKWVKITSVGNKPQIQHPELAKAAQMQF